MKFRNVSPLGALELPAVGRVIEPEEVFDIRPDLAVYVAAQAKTWAPADAEAEAVVASLAPEPEAPATTPAPPAPPAPSEPATAAPTDKKEA